MHVHKTVATSLAHGNLSLHASIEIVNFKAFSPRCHGCHTPVQLLGVRRQCQPSLSNQIPNTESVSTLKEVIKDKKKPKLDHVAASSLALWKVSTLMGLGLQQNLANEDLMDDLVDVFSDEPPPKCLHIIVKLHVGE
jgi:hypothetical protein